MTKRIIAAVAALLFALTAMPLALAKAVIPTRYSTPSGYDDHDYQKLVAFLEQEDEDGVKNGSKTSSYYAPESPGTWGGVTWTTVGGVKHIGEYDRSSRKLVGSLDLSGCTAMTSLFCYDCNLASVDVSGCTALMYLAVNENPLTSLDVSGCTALAELRCHASALTSLDLSGLTALYYVSGGECELASIDVSGCTALSELFIRNNELTELDLSGLTALTRLDCAMNPLRELVLSDCAGLIEIDCEGDPLTSLDLTANPNLKLDRLTAGPNGTVSCRDNHAYGSSETVLFAQPDESCVFLGWYSASDEFLSSNKQYDVSDNENTEYVAKFKIVVGDDDHDGYYDNDYNKLYSFLELEDENGVKNGTKLNVYYPTQGMAAFEDSMLIQWFTVDELKYLGRIYSGSNTLVGRLDVSNCPHLLDIDCSNTCIASLDVSGCTALESLRCDNNSDLTSVFAFGCTALESLSCSTGGLTELDVSGCTALESLYCDHTVLTSLDVSGLTALTDLYCNNSALTELTVSGCTALTTVWASDSALESLDASGLTALEYLNCDDCALTELSVSGCTALNELWCYDNELTELDVSGLTSLTGLYCNDNVLTELTVSGCTALQTLQSGSNLMTSLDVSDCASLKTLNCRETCITSLDVSGKTALNELYCDNCLLTSLDLTGCTAITPLWCRNNALTELDVSDCGILSDLDCIGNALNELDLTGNSRLWLGSLSAGEGGVVGCHDQRVYYVGSILYENVDLWAAPDPGYVFEGWYNGDGELVSEEAEFRVASSSSSDVFRAEFKASLGVPSITLSSVDSTGKVKVSWGEVEGAVKYEVWRSAEKTGTYVKAKTTTALSYTNTAADAGDKYWYKVRAIAADGTAGEFCLPRYRYTHLAQPVVTGTHAASSGNNKIVWEEVEGAKEYKVYRSTEKNGEYSLMKTTTNLSYTNSTNTAPGETYYYYVVAVHDKSAANSAASATKTLTVDLARPVVSVSLTSKGKPKLTWDAVSGAKEYKVYRSTSSGTGYSLVFTTTKLSYSNTGAAAGTTYYYKVMAIHEKSAANSAYSQVVSITTK